MTANVIPFNPLDTKSIGASVADAQLVKDAQPLAFTPFIDVKTF